MHVVVFHHSEENFDRVKIWTIKGPSLYRFLQNNCQKIKGKTKINCNQIHTNE